MTRARGILIGVGVALLAIVVLGTMSMFDNESEDAAYPTFASTPAPVEYNSIADMAAALEGDGLPCDALEYQDIQSPGQASVEEFATCYLFGDRARNVELWLFETEKKRDKWVMAFQTSTLVVVGPNWVATPQDEERAAAVMGAIGGKLVGVPPTS